MRDQARTSTAAALRDLDPRPCSLTAAALRDLDRSALLAVALEALAVGGDAPFASALASRAETSRRAAALFGNLAPELVAIVLSFVDARDVLRGEVAGAPLREAASEARLWAGLLRATWPREGAALCSLGNERLTFRAFHTKRPAIQDLDSRRDRGPSYLSSAFDEGSLVFLLAIGPFAGVCQWVKPSLGKTVWDGPLYWRPQSNDTLFDVHHPFSGWHWWDEEVIWIRIGDQFSQTLYVIDTNTNQCVTLFSDVFPSSMQQMMESTEVDSRGSLMKPNDVLMYAGGDAACDFFCHDHLTRDTYVGEEDDLPADAEYCIVNPFLTLRHDDEDETKVRLHEANLSFDHGEDMTVLHPHQFRQFMAAVIHQTHESFRGYPSDP